MGANFSLSGKGGKAGNLILAGLVVSILVLMVIPLPTFVLDLLLTLNMGVAAMLLLVALYVTSPLKIATFPSLLLVATMFRLGLNVASTRLILLQADAGSVVESFGQFVVSGNVIVGAVVFLILTLIQFIVIAKGSERVAEVAARFTLDAMPGKQMAIDAELRAGHISHDRAKRERRALHRESQLYGAMDGAMKFVKGDAIAGLIITAVNIIGGLAVGMIQMNMSSQEAVTTYSVLTVGDGLVAQIPSLLISLSAGFIITRVASEEEGTQLGGEIGRQIVSQPTAIFIVGVLLIGMGIVPGMPTIPFLLLGSVALYFGRRHQKRLQQKESDAQRQKAMGTIAPQIKEPLHKDEGPLPLPLVEPLAIELPEELAPFAAQNTVEGQRLQDELLGEVRSSIYWEFGVVVPPITVRVNENMSAGQYQLLLFEQPLGQGELEPDSLAVANGPHCPEGGTPVRWSHGAKFNWVPGSSLEALLEADVEFHDPLELLVFHFKALLKTHLGELVNMETAQILLTALSKTHPALVGAATPEPVTLTLLTEVLSRLAQEGVSLRHMDRILKALLAWVPKEGDPVLLTEYVRMELRREVSSKYASGGLLAVYMASQGTEEEVRAGITRGDKGSFLSMDPEVTLEIQEKARELFGGISPSARPMVVLCSMDIRRYLRQLLVMAEAEIVVLSYQELDSKINVQPIGEL